ncbi:GTP cyclohydrolase I FolE, partial [Vibrio sinaloensis]
MLTKEAEKVRNALLSRGLETPMTSSEMSSDQKYNRIKGLLTEVVSTLGLDLTDDSLAETPHRIA